MHDAGVAARTIKAAADRWQEVADAVHDRRIELDLTAKEVVDRAGHGLSLGVLSQIENARNPSYAVRTIKALCRALGWTANSIELVIAGGAPVESPEGVEARTLVERVDDLEQAVARITEQLELLRDGPNSGRSA